MLWTGVLKTMIKYSSGRQRWSLRGVGARGSQGEEPVDISVKDDQREEMSRDGQ